MKNIFALILAASMLSCTAFAEVVDKADAAANPGDTIELSMSDFVYEDDDTVKLGEANDDLGTTKDMKEYDFCSDNFRVSAKMKKGSDLLEYAKFDDDKNIVEIKFKKNNLLERPLDTKGANLVFENVEVKSRRTVKDDEDIIIKGSKTFVAEGMASDWKIGYDVEDSKSAIYGDEYILSDFGYHIVNDMDDANDPSDYAKATMLYEDNNYKLEGKVFAGDKFYINIETSFADIMDIVKANSDAEFTPYTVTADGLSSTMKMYFKDAEKDTYIYKYDKANKRLTQANVRWSEEEAAYYTTFRNDAIFITSDVQLKGAVNEGVGTNDNPNTGR